MAATSIVIIADSHTELCMAHPLYTTRLRQAFQNLPLADEIHIHGSNKLGYMLPQLWCYVDPQQVHNQQRYNQQNPLNSFHWASIPSTHDYYYQTHTTGYQQRRRPTVRHHRIVDKPRWQLTPDPANPQQLKLDLRTPYLRATSRGLINDTAEAQALTRMLDHVQKKTVIQDVFVIDPHNHALLASGQLPPSLDPMFSNMIVSTFRTVTSYISLRTTYAQLSPYTSNGVNHHFISGF